MRSLLTLTFIALLSASNVLAEDSPLSSQYSLGLFSNYMFRGISRYEGMSIQPSVVAAYDGGDWGSFSGAIWSQIPTDDTSTETGFLELDQSLTYDQYFGPVGVSIGHAVYAYPDGSDQINDTAELFIAFAFDSVLSPKFSIYRDYRELDLAYYELSLSESISIAELGENLTLSPFLALGFATDAKSRYTRDGIEHLVWGLCVDAYIGNLTFQPTISYNQAIDPNTDNELWFGITLSYSR